MHLSMLSLAKGSVTPNKKPLKFQAKFHIKMIKISGLKIKNYRIFKSLISYQFSKMRRILGTP